MPKTLDQLERENNALRRILKSQAQIIKEMCECLPDEFKELESVQRAISTSTMVIEEVGKLT